MQLIIGNAEKCQSLDSLVITRRPIFGRRKSGARPLFHKIFVNTGVHRGGRKKKRFFAEMSSCDHGAEKLSSSLKKNLSETQPITQQVVPQKLKSFWLCSERVKLALAVEKTMFFNS